MIFFLFLIQELTKLLLLLFKKFFHFSVWGKKFCTSRLFAFSNSWFEILLSGPNLLYISKSWDKRMCKYIEQSLCEWYFTNDSIISCDYSHKHIICILLLMERSEFEVVGLNIMLTKLSCSSIASLLINARLLDRIFIIKSFTHSFTFGKVWYFVY